jgi:hypothetical protein
MKPPKCPKCGGKGVPIVYGMPSEKTWKLVDQGKVELGGCEVGEDGQGEFDWKCRGCGNEWKDKK